MPKKHIYWILIAALISFCSAWCADPYAGTFRYMVRKIRAHAIRSLSERELFDAGMTGLIASVDENSSYIPPQTYQELNDEFSQEIGTTGILFFQDGSQKCRVGSTLPFSSAKTAGIESGDEILSVDGTLVENLAFLEIQKKLSPPVGIEISVEIFRPSKQKKLTFPLVSQKVPVKSVHGAFRLPDGTWSYTLPPLPDSSEFLSAPESAVQEADSAETSVPPSQTVPQTNPLKAAQPKILYVKLTTFGEKTVQEMRQILRDGSKDGAVGLVLDLRGNGGGLVEAAKEICQMFLQERSILMGLVHANSQTELIAGEPSGTHRIWFKPVVVLIDEETASASEILAVCLQDYGKNGSIDAICVGTRTYGKGTIQDIFDLGPIPDDRYLAEEQDPKTLWQRIWEKPQRGGFRISTSMYVSPTGRPIHRFRNAPLSEEWGVEPNPGWEIHLKDHPECQKDLKKFAKDWFYFDHLKDSGGLSEERQSEIYEKDVVLKRAMDYFSK